MDGGLAPFFDPWVVSREPALAHNSEHVYQHACSLFIAVLLRGASMWQLQLR